jgi:hypothetical protein
MPEMPGMLGSDMDTAGALAGGAAEPDILDSQSMERRGRGGAGV